MACNLRLMCKEDLPQVNEIDREVFPTLWPPANYQRELKNRLAYYIVACDDEEGVELPEPKVAPQKGSFGLMAKLRQLFNHNRFLGNESPPSEKQYIFGFAGFWMMAGEAHITNIAVREQYQRQGIGELLLISLIDLARELGARLMTLEVRASNTSAQSLYAKYGFIQVGVRRGYYTDNREDGVLMSIEDITSTLVQAHLQQLKQAHVQRWGITATMLLAKISPVQPGNQ